MRLRSDIKRDAIVIDRLHYQRLSVALRRQFNRSRKNFELRQRWALGEHEQGRQKEKPQQTSGNETFVKYFRHQFFAAACSRSACSFRSCSKRLSRFSGGLTGASVFAATTGLGASMRSTPPDPTVCVMGSPSFWITTLQKSVLCWPTGLCGSTATSNTTSLSSFVISLSGAVTLAGRPSNLTVALPSKGTFCSTAQATFAGCPCSVTVVSIFIVRNGGATSSRASCEETHNGAACTVAEAT